MVYWNSYAVFNDYFQLAWSLTSPHCLSHTTHLYALPSLALSLSHPPPPLPPPFCPHVPSRANTLLAVCGSQADLISPNRRSGASLGAHGRRAWQQGRCQQPGRCRLERVLPGLSICPAPPLPPNSSLHRRFVSSPPPHSHQFRPPLALLLPSSQIPTSPIAVFARHPPPHLRKPPSPSLSSPRHPHPPGPQRTNWCHPRPPGRPSPSSAPSFRPL